MPGHCTGADSQSAGQGLTPGHWAEWAVLGVSEQATLGLRLWL
jgi:mannose/cellobiose epimerase-like protein (N-acyl-D-glucosamine 2-epimerase family)